MHSSNQDRTQEIFAEALQVSPEGRAAFLEQACAGEPDQRSAVEELLCALDDAGRDGFLSSPTSAGGGGGLAAVPKTEPEKKIGPYRLLERVGEGGFGEVWTAMQSEPIRRTVAVKILKPGMDSKEVLARFEVERQALALMQHPNVARVYDAGATGQGRPYFVMEHVAGLPLTEYCDGTRLPIKKRLELFLPICEAVQHAHTKGIIHRDLKPSNILVTLTDGAPIPKVIDFGIAKATAAPLTDRTLHTETGRLIGTPEYMSPEQCGTGGLDVDTRSDVYSLGVILYQLVTGTLPFEPSVLRKTDYTSLVKIIRETEPPMPSSRLSTIDDEPVNQHGGTTLREISERRDTEFAALRRQVKGELDWIVMKCLEKERTRRYETASELAADVRRFLAAEPVVAAPPSRVYRFRKFVRRNRVAVTAGTVVVASLLVAIAGTSYERMRADRLRVDAETAQMREREQRELADERRAEAVAAQAREREQRELAERRRAEAVAAQTREREQRELAERRQAEAVAAQAREREQRELAEKRAQQTQEVADFQASMLGEIGVQEMGRGIKQRFREEVRMALARQHVGEFPDRRLRTVDEVDAELAEFDRRADLALATDLARDVLKEFVLAPAAAAIEKKFGEQPLVQARLHGSIGSFYGRLGLHQDAELHLRTALGIYRRHHGQEVAHPEIARCIYALGHALWDRALYSEAEKQYEAALAMWHALGNREAVASHLTMLGSAIGFQRRFRRADELLREALRINKDLYTEDHPSYVDCQGHLAILRYKQGKFEEAEKLNRQVLEWRLDKLGPTHPQVAQTLFNLAFPVAAQAGRIEEAIDHLRSSLKINLHQHGEAHPLVAKTRFHIGRLLMRLEGRRDEAEDVLQEALAQQRRLLGNDNREVVQILEVLAFSRDKVRDYEGSARWWREVLDINERLYPAGHPETYRRCAAMATLGRALASQARVLASTDPEHALAIFRQAAPLLSAGLPGMLADPRSMSVERRRSCADLAASIFGYFDKVAPGNGWGAEAARWRAESEKLRKRGGSRVP